MVTIKPQMPPHNRVKILMLPINLGRQDLVQARELTISSNLSHKKSMPHKLKEYKSLIIKESMHNKTIRGLAVTTQMQVSKSFLS
jgi:hypothetical protein